MITMVTGHPVRGNTRPATQALPDARVNEYFQYNVAFEGLVEPITFQWHGDLPPGLAKQQGKLYGTPKRSETQAYHFRVTVTDALGVTLAGNYMLRVRPEIRALKILSRQLPPFVMGQNIDFAIVASGGRRSLYMVRAKAGV